MERFQYEDLLSLCSRNKAAGTWLKLHSDWPTRVFTGQVVSPEHDGSTGGEIGHLVLTLPGEGLFISQAGDSWEYYNFWSSVMKAYVGASGTVTLFTERPDLMLIIDDHLSLVLVDEWERRTAHTRHDHQ